jgi:hypothetical protein
MLTAAGKGQEWTADRPEAFWRSFAATDITDRLGLPLAQLTVMNFVNRYGDPTGQLDRSAEAGEQIVSDTNSWAPLIEGLSQVAAAWDPPDKFGISRWSGDKPRADAADKALRKLLPHDTDGDKQISKEIEVIYFRQSLTLWPQTLRAFMTASAASARAREINMRQCLRCHDWFELRRSDAVYCSPSCQAFDHKMKRAMEERRSRE